MSKLIKTILLFTMVVIFSYNYCYGIDLNLTENTTTNAASQNAQTQANSATATNSSNASNTNTNTNNLFQNTSNSSSLPTPFFPAYKRIRKSCRIFPVRAVPTGKYSPSYSTDMVPIIRTVSIPFLSISFPPDFIYCEKFSRLYGQYNP